MSEPVYDEDFVSLGYLNKVINNETNSASNISKHYGTKPKPPYFSGDTWTEGSIVHTCINTRLIGLYDSSDWVSESGAKEEAESKNKIYLTQPSNYNIGDMWILQDDNDHKSGKKGEILITTVQRNIYNSDDWINMLIYEDVASINEALFNLANAIKKVGISNDAIEIDKLIVCYYQEPENMNFGDFWYVENEETLYRYNGIAWDTIQDEEVISAFKGAKEEKLITDGKINSFYTDIEPTNNITIGDIWSKTDESDSLYRYNGTKWVPVYDTRVNSTIEEVNRIVERLVVINTDLGSVSQRITDTERKVDEDVVIRLSELEHTIDGLVLNTTTNGGDNLFYYSIGFWETVHLEEYRNTEIKYNSKSGYGYLINAGTSKQTIEQISNGNYTISFRYKKLLSLAECNVKINDIEYELTSEDWDKFSQTIQVTSNHINIEFISDADSSCYITDVLVNAGDTANVWTQNPNETRTDTITIGKGIQVDNIQANTYTRIDADGNRIYNKNTNQVVAEFTDKGTETKELVVREQAEISGLLFQKVGNQTWISSLL